MNTEIPESRQPAADGSFEIYLAWSGQVLKVGAGQSALEVLLQAGVPIEPGCLTGGCGDCATAYVEGDVIHKDLCLNGKDRERIFCPCVSRAMTRIVLAFRGGKSVLAENQNALRGSAF